MEFRLVTQGKGFSSWTFCQTVLCDSPQGNSSEYQMKINLALLDLSTHALDMPYWRLHEDKTRQAWVWEKKMPWTIPHNIYNITWNIFSSICFKLK